LDPQRDTEPGDHEQQEELRDDLPHEVEDDVHGHEKPADHREDDPLKSFGIKPVGNHGAQRSGGGGRYRATPCR